MYKGYVVGNEFVRFFGRGHYEDLIRKVFMQFQETPCWSLKDFNRELPLEGVFPEWHVWFIDNTDKEMCLNGWNESAVIKEGYFKATPEEFVKHLLGENYMHIDHEIKSEDNSIENLTLVKVDSTVKPRYHHKRKPVPTRKKTDITVYYSTGEQYTIKNVKALHVSNSSIAVAMHPETKNGFFVVKSFGFDTQNVDSFLVKSPQGKYTLDHVGNGQFILTENQTVITLSSINQIF